MRVADPEAIQRGEKALAEAIASNFEPGVIQEIFKKFYNLEVGDDIRCKNASMDVYEGKIAYSVNFEVLVNLSVFLDRSGNFISVSGGGASGEAAKEAEAALLEKSETKPGDKTSADASPNGSGQMASTGTYESVLEDFAPVQP